MGMVQRDECSVNTLKAHVTCEPAAAALALLTGDLGHITSLPLRVCYSRADADISSSELWERMWQVSDKN